ncbi:MAG: YlxM family DNA-binding protein [Lachnospiraceae bacterium]|nr:YlxM family DNA-binding protein [Lachnospiraceae bacterium]
MEKILEVSLLYDFYGELLTNKQKLIFEMKYLNDFSFSEIGENLGISRQAAFDQLQRTEKILNEYEEKLKLVSKFIEEKKLLSEIKLIISDIENSPDNKEIHKNIKRLKKISDKILL